MRRLFFAVPVLALVLAGCFLTGHKNTTAGQSTVADPVPNDGVARKYKSYAVTHPVLVNLSDGISYTITSNGNGPAAHTGDTIKALYKGMLTNDTVFDASYLHGNKPYSFPLGQRRVIAGWDSVLVHAHAGDKIRMTIPPKYGYGAHPNGKIPANATLVFEVEVIDVAARPAPWDAKGKDTITTPSGLKIIYFEKHPENLQAKTGNTVTVHYSGYLLDGTMFDSSVKTKQPLVFTLGKDPVIKGWAEGITLMHKGEKAQLIIPYTLGYGEQGYPGVIPPKSMLIFDVQLLDIR